jgi:protein phosphatase
METINLHTLVLMIGPSGSGKSTFAAKNFPAHEIVSSDGVRAELLGDFRIQTSQDAVWTEVHRRARTRLAFGQRVIVDATNLRIRDRRAFIDMAKYFGVELVYLVINRPVDAKLKTAGWRLEVDGLIQKHEEIFNNNLKEIMRGDGVARVVRVWDNTAIRLINHPVNGTKCLVNATVNGEFQIVTGPVMVIGDVHGNLNDLDALLVQAVEMDAHVLFLGDIVDYGFYSVDTVFTVYDLIRNGKAHMIWGNHERKVDRWINADFGNTFKGVVGPGLAVTANEINGAIANDPAFKDKFLARWRCLANHSRQCFNLGDRYLLTHGASTMDMWEMGNLHTLYGVHQNMAFFGQVDTKQPTLSSGMPNRIYQWIDEIPKGKTVIVGHDPRDKINPMVVDNVNGGRAVFLDTGSSKGGVLSMMIINDY